MCYNDFGDRMINKIINIDLHIHSDASKYKDDIEIVKNSNIENIDILFQKLIKHEIELFSITDHNRFNLELYKAINLELSKDDSPYNFSLLAGVEFDVVFDTGKKAAHIVTIFDCKSEDDYVKISDAINSNKLENKDQTYLKLEYEEILKKIGLDTILIVHQKKSLDNSNGRHASLSDSSSNPYKVIEVGYVDALEYQKPNVQGIIKNNLKEVSKSVSLVTGTDCHDWNEYPKHSKGKNDFEGPFTKIKALPTFKGLHISLMSPETRINRKKNSNTNYLESFTVNGKVISLDPGLNAIIGENGSGKSTLLSFIGSNISSKYQKDIVRDNNLIMKTHLVDDRIKYFSQTEIVTKYNKKKLFGTDGGYYKDIDNSGFKDEYERYGIQLKNAINSNISRFQSKEFLKDLNFIFSGEYNKTNFYVSIPPYAVTIVNPHEEHKNNLKMLIERIVVELNNDYYQTYKFDINLNRIFKELLEVYDQVLESYLMIDIEIKTKNLITSAISNYNRLKSVKETDKGIETSHYNSTKEVFISSVVKAIELDSQIIKFPEPPKLISGTSENTKHGFKFNRESAYNQKNLTQEFLNAIFNKQYQSIEALKQIRQKSILVDSVAGASNDTFDSKWTDLIANFIKKYSSTNEYILEASVSKAVGNTMGELSLTYYKYHLQESINIDVFLIDQPEDNISNTKIVEDLIQYFNSIRHEKQIIFVTHNPLLVINLDVDNVISLEKVNNTVIVSSGCIEDEENKVIENISEKMEGGKEMIEKRLKVYG